jgi:3-dehydroquinate dehydratase type II
MHILLLHGPNLNLLGTREPEVYGSMTQEELVAQIQQAAERFGMQFSFLQSNHEGVLMDTLQQTKADVVIFNPAAYTHTSIALMDTIRAITVPVIEVHLSDLSTRERYRQFSYIKDVSVASFMGNHLQSYLDALHYIKENLT